MGRSLELSYWICARETMRLRHAAGDKNYDYGYSDDPLMGSIRYCNVRREDDKVTKWLAQNWRPQYHEVWQILLARLINNVPTLARLRVLMEYPDALDSVRSHLKALRQDGPIFGSAYTVSTNGHSMDKVDYIIDRVVAPARQVTPKMPYGLMPEAFGDQGASITLASANEWLVGMLNGVSTFMSGQIIADLKNTAGHPLQNAPDWHTWAAPGPGSLRGLSAYWNRPISPAGFTAALRGAWEEVRPLLPVELHDLHMQDFQNCMCEFSKYMRAKNGGHVRNRYRG